MNRTRLGNCLLLMLASCLASHSIAAACPPPSYNRAALEALKVSKFEIADDAQRQALALNLIPCLENADPELRDGIAFEAYHSWMRANRLDVATRTALLTRLGALLEPGKANDKSGFRQPFAALVLSEVARTDRIAAWLDATQRAALVDLAARYVASVRDYRGFDAKQGWRHGVAHGSDLILQLVLSPAVDRAGIDRLLGAVATQVAPPGEHFYIYGESERLARPVLYAAQRGLTTAAEWEKWLRQVAAAPTTGAPATGTQAALARTHNLQAFFYSLYVNARESSDANIQALVPGLQAVLRL